VPRRSRIPIRTPLPPLPIIPQRRARCATAALVAARSACAAALACSVMAASSSGRAISPGSRGPTRPRSSWQDCGSRAPVQSMLGKQQIDRLLPERLCRRLAVESELSKLLQRQRDKIDRKHPLPSPAGPGPEMAIAFALASMPGICFAQAWPMAIS